MRSSTRVHVARFVAVPVAGITLCVSACSGSDGQASGSPTAAAHITDTSASPALSPVGTIPAAQATSTPAASAWGWFATSAPTTGASATARGELPTGVDPASFPHTSEGAETYARTYLAAESRALSAADSSGLSGWSAATCDACSEQIEKIEKIDLLKTRGQRPSAPVTTHANLTTSGRGDQYVVQGTVADGAITLVDASGAVAFTQPARTQALQLVVSWVGGRWVISAQNAFAQKQP